MPLLEAGCGIASLTPSLRDFCMLGMKTAICITIIVDSTKYVDYNSNRILIKVLIHCGDAPVDDVAQKS